MANEGVAHMLEIAAWLQAQSVGTIGRTIIVNAEPDRVGGAASTGPEVFLLEEQPPQSAFVYGSSGPAVQVFRFRVNTRSTEPTADMIAASSRARNKARDAYIALCKVTNRSLSSTRSGSTGVWLSALPESQPFLAGVDSRKRTVFTFVVRAERNG